VSEEPGPEHVVEHLDLVRRARSAIERLPVAQRSAVELAYFGHRSSSEVAELQGIPLGTAKSRIRKGITTLREDLAETDQAS
jgi:RNA polymerase sigma-70 factor (ECF subfamily)